MSEPAPITKPLEEMTKAELFEIAQQREIPGRYDMNKEALFKAVEEALTAPTEPAPPPSEGEATEEGEEPAEGEEVDGEAEATNPVNEKPDAELEKTSDTKAAEPVVDPAVLAAQRGALEAELLKGAQEREAKLRETEAAEEARKRLELRALEEKKQADAAAAHAAGLLTEDDKLMILRASSEELEGLLGDSPPEFVRVAVTAEVERRKLVKKSRETRALVKSPHKQFKITGNTRLLPSGLPNMRYVTPTAYVTSLPVGSLVTPLAHDLLHVQDQGFTWEEVKGIEHGEDQLGNRTSVAK